jgi:PPOX class probable F420-dependent enzyme
MSTPTPAAPGFTPGYGVNTDASGAERLPWSWAVEQLTAARNYWISTTRPDGRPHAVPVWGLWLDDAVWFSTDRASRKARNLDRDPSVVVHLDSGDEVVILEGRVEEVGSVPELVRFADAYEAKYAVRPSDDGTSGPVYRLRPERAYTWLEADYPKTATRWVFPDQSPSGARNG